MTSQIDRSRPIADTQVFDGAMSRKGYRINKFCMSLASAESRAAFLADEEAFMVAAGLDEGERRLVRTRDFPGLIDAGGNIYMLIKLGATVGHGLYHIGADLRGETFDQFLATRKDPEAR